MAKVWDKKTLDHENCVSEKKPTERAPVNDVTAVCSDDLPPFRKPNGMGWFIVAVFLVDDLAGGGIVAIPTAMVQTEFYLGFAMLLLALAVTTYTAHVLGLSWNILLDTWPEYRVHCRSPYPEVAFRAMGDKARKLVLISNGITQFGISVVYLLLSSKNIHDTIKTFADTDLSYCYVVLIVAVCLLPITFLKSPQDFWWAVVVAMFTSGAGIVLILVGTALDYGLCSEYKGVPPLRTKNFFLALGTVIFSCGGHAAFPTIQHDMRDPRQYYKSVFTGFSILLFIYGPIAILGFFTYHDSIRDSILPSIQTIWIQETCNVLITIHCILTLIIMINPLNQDLEELFHCPHHFCWQRVAVRTGCMLGVVFAGESIPNFGPLLDLVGGSAQTLSSVILPALFYLFLVSGQRMKEKLGRHPSSSPTLSDVLQYAPRSTLIMTVFIVLVGVAGGAAATFSAILEISTVHFQSPCYINAFSHQKHPNDNAASLYCCGPFQNITHTGRTDLCVPMPSTPFYG
ncbi:hypothetical protein Q1695_002546 [Nippostrongylus brasiliensis]|nr:hypothetical protein Q1695_002546 [Nippostrongylus brasiliensis]